MCIRDRLLTHKQIKGFLNLLVLAYICVAVCLQIVVDETQIDLFQQVTDSVDRVHVDVQTLRQINIIVEKYVI